MSQCVVGIKFCGGCKPSYDRAVLFETIKKRLGERVQFVAPDSHGVAFILAIHGCDTACADLSAYQTLSILMITGENALDRFYECIDNWLDINA